MVNGPCWRANVRGRAVKELLHPLTVRDKDIAVVHSRCEEAGVRSGNKLEHLRSTEVHDVLVATASCRGLLATFGELLLADIEAPQSKCSTR